MREDSRTITRGRKYTTITFFDIVDARDCGAYDSMKCRIPNEIADKISAGNYTIAEERKMIAQNHA